MSTIKVTFDNKIYTSPNNITVLKAASLNNIFIPSWCAIKHQAGSQVCRLCIVEIDGFKGAVNSCGITVKDGMKITVNSLALNKTRKTLLKLLLKSHKNCKDLNCELENLAIKLDIKPQVIQSKASPLKELSSYLLYNKDLCVHCERCVNSCTQQKSLEVVHKTRDISLKNDSIKTSCIQCGDCIFMCKAGALTENSIVKGL
ncbi:MAG: (2Fe-2S)-binding protein [Candidatus Cloacimonetes bacterium]|nr:(2Fe-2S)-binding protein [Candidatus Cloacimonadota bacterium]